MLSSPIASKQALRDYALKKAGKFWLPVILLGAVVSGLSAWLQEPQGWSWVRNAFAGVISGMAGWTFLYAVYRYRAPTHVMGKDFDRLSNAYEKVIEERNQLRKEFEEAQYALGLPQWGMTNPETKKKAELSHVAQRIIRERDDV